MESVSFQKQLNVEDTASPSRILLVLLCMMCVIALLSSDIYLPAMPIIAHAFNTHISNVQYTLSIYLLGLSICQLIYGPLSDYWGRKKILTIGIAIFIIASVACTLSKTLPQLLIARFFQALGACSGMVMSRAIAGDLFGRVEAAKVFTAIFPVVGASSAIAPIIGGYLTDWSGWQACFLFLSFFGCVLFLGIILFLGETKKRIGNSETLRTVLKEIPLIFTNYHFIGYTLIVSSAYAAYFVYLAESPFIFQRYGFAPHQIGFFYILLSLFYIVGNLTGRKLINYMSVNGAIIIGICLFLISSISLLCESFIGTSNPFWIIMAMSIQTSGNGFLFPLGTASTVTLFPQSAGTASGLMGFLQLSTASLSVGLLGYTTHNQELPMAIFITCTALVCTLSFYFFIFKRAHINEQI